MTESLWDDVKSLKHSKTLSTSIEDDKYRRQVDAAKKRAAAQNVDYPTFAAMVSAAHLQPVDRKRLAEPRADTKRTAPAWSFSSSGSLLKADDVRSQAGTEAPILSKRDVLESLEKLKSFVRGTGNADVPPTAARTVGPMTQDAFRKSWRSLSTEPPDKRLEFLANVGPFPRIFRVEVPPDILTGVLGTLLDALGETQGPGGVSAVVKILESISKCSRFAITMKLMGQRNRAVVDRLFDILSYDSELDELRSKFTV
ncbi:coiled-coil domain-containing protein 103 homolog [Selaginella moellendorffii]|uniref:coiled-coil domain-containing protein 103 homolog n=1 Tax=Selaginella moellendorffii TaxID=88036 RepID=UPI000D1CBEC5|nr:coiled-coil domain-containing protein 103 homolog [Selaginella moellendorffii]|eukprot:XP_024542438.1 coiled-coil domain-containing protein 103 homolog [Selaginella moellendorffii]